MEICKESGCHKFKNSQCLIFPESGVEFRRRQGYCPFPDYPKSEKALDKVRQGQQKQKIKKKK